MKILFLKKSRFFPVPVPVPAKNVGLGLDPGFSGPGKSRSRFFSNFPVPCYPRMKCYLRITRRKSSPKVVRYSYCVMWYGRAPFEWCWRCNKQTKWNRLDWEFRPSRSHYCTPKICTFCGKSILNVNQSFVFNQSIHSFSFFMHTLF